MSFKNYITEMTKITSRITLIEAIDIVQEIGAKINMKIINCNELKSYSVFIPNRLIITGSIRRQKSTIGDIDLVCTKNISLNDIQKMPGVKEIWSRGIKQVYFNYVSNKGILRSINFFIITDPKSFGAFMLHTTGDNLFNIILRKKAKKKNLKLNQYGIFNIIDNKKIAGETEQSIFDALGMKYVEPENRNINNVI